MSDTSTPLFRLQPLLGTCRAIAAPLSGAPDFRETGFRAPGDDTWETLPLIITDGAVTNVGDLLERGVPIVFVPPWGAAHPGKATGRRVDRAGVVLEEVARCRRSAMTYVLVPAPILVAESTRAVREALWQSGCLRWIAHFTAQHIGVADVLGSVQIAMAAMGPSVDEDPHREPPTIAMLDGDKAIEVMTEKHAKKAIEDLMGPHGTSNEFGYRFMWKSPSEPLSYALHDPALAKAEHQLNQHSPMHRLEEILDLCFMGRAPIASRQEGATEVPTLRAADLRILADLTRDDLQTTQGGALDDAHRLRSGDVVVSAIFDQHAVAGVVPENLEGVVPGPSLFVLRLKQSTAADAALLADYLRTTFARDWLAARSSGLAGFVRLNAGTLKDLPVPAFSGPLMEAISSLAGTTRRLEDLARRYDSARREVFSVASSSEQIRGIQNVAAQAAMVRDLLDSVDDFSSLIRRTFPFPIALGWRVFEAEEDPRRRYKSALDLFEATAVYLAVMLLSEMRKDAGSAPTVQTLLKKFKKPGHGPTLGEWIEVLKLGAKSIPERDLVSSAYPELRLVCGSTTGSSFWTVVDELKARRNDFAHQRGPSSDREFAKAVVAVNALLNQLFGELRFLARYPLRFVLAAKYDEITDSRSVEYRELIGDHHVVATRTSPVGGETSRGLHFLDQTGKLRLATPWLIYAECPECLHYEVVAPEFWARPGERIGVVYKSLTTGHMHPTEAENWDRLARFVGFKALG